MPKIISLTQNEWIEQFEPVGNPGSHTGFEIDGESCGFETYGEDLKAVRAAQTAQPGCVWSMVDSGEDWPQIEHGMCVVNVLFYLITRVPGDAECEYQIEDED